MKPIICVLVLGTIVAVQSAPALLAQQYLLITPEAQLQLAPALKLQQPILQPITQVKKIGNLKNDENKEIVLYYPNTPLVQYPTVLPLRQNFPSWDGFVQAIQDFFQQGEDDKPDEMQQEMSDSKKGTQESAKLEFENDAETINPQPAPPASVPAPVPNFPIIPTLNGHRFYILGGEPQFYGNFAGLSDPTNPLYAFQPILTKRRSVETANEAILDGSVEALPSSDVDTKNIPQNILAQAEPRFQSKYPAALNEGELNSAAELEGKEQSFQKAGEKPPTSAEQSLKISDDPSVARAGPEGIALAGKGGLAASYPFSTALVGKGGLALSSPSATSIAGDFLDVGKA